MTIRRGSLYAGVFVLAVGAVTLAGAGGTLDRTAVADTVGTLWPLAVIVLGLGLLLRRTPASLPTGVAAAVVPGLLLGGALVAAPTLPAPCNGGTVAGQAQTQQGSIDGRGTVELDLACGDLQASMQPGNAWRLDSTDGADRRTSVSQTGTGFTARAQGGSRGWSQGPVAWTATLPTAPVLDVTARIEAGRGRLDLAGAQLGDVRLNVDAGDLRADLTGAALGRLTLGVNAGSAVVTLPADAFSGSVTANAGSVRVCVPASLALRVNATSSLASVRFNGLVRQGDTWVSPQSTATPTATADLTVDANVGSVTINPEGGCK